MSAKPAKSKGNHSRKNRPSSKPSWVLAQEQATVAIRTVKEPKVSLIGAIRAAIRENEVLIAQRARIVQVGVLDPELAEAMVRIKELKKQLQAAYNN